MSAVLLSRFVRDLRVEPGRIAQNAHFGQSSPVSVIKPVEAGSDMLIELAEKVAPPTRKRRHTIAASEVEERGAAPLAPIRRAGRGHRLCEGLAAARLPLCLASINFADVLPHRKLLLATFRLASPDTDTRFLPFDGRRCLSILIDGSYLGACRVSIAGLED